MSADASDAELVASIRHVSKRFCTSMDRSLRYGLRDILRETSLRRREGEPVLRKDEFWALQDVSFDVRPGESWGLIGDNGSGKSTLLRIVHGLTKPDAGSVTVRGRHGGLLDLGSLFVPLQTGRENALAMAAVLGVERRRVLDLLESIIDFAGIGDFIDAPVQTYSSGMRTRLAFATAAHLDLDLFLIDEALLVGDLAFRRKCIRWCQEYVREGGALILVDHDLWIMQSVCTRCVVLDHGRVLFAGPTTEAIRLYTQRQPESTEAAAHSVLSAPTGPLVLGDVSVTATDGDTPRPGGAVDVVVGYEAEEATAPVTWGFVVVTGDQMITVATELAPGPGRVLPAGSGTLRARIVDLPLAPGEYGVRIVVADAATREPVALAGWEEEPARLRVSDPFGELRAVGYAVVGSVVHMEGAWTVEPAAGSTGA